MTDIGPRPASVDIAIVGAGMAGASLAAALAPHASVAMVEAEERPGYHATGRSAAFWMETYGGPGVAPLTAASGAFLRDPPPDFAASGFLRRRGCLHVARAGAESALDRLAADFAGSGVRLEPVGRKELAARVPGLRPGWTRALAEPSCSDIDVAALHQAYLVAARRAGAALVCASPLVAADRAGGRWSLRFVDGEPLSAAIVVDAAGAWADGVAALAGVLPLGLRAFRRTMAQLRVDPPVPSDLPLVLDAETRFYFKAEAGGRLWLTPHDETPAAPGDAAPEEIDVARAVSLLETCVDWRVRGVERRWAGLRTFAPDRLPVYGFDARVPGFFWFSGQGGFGIQTAPAAADLAARLLLGKGPGMVDPAPFAPGRFG